ncbi:MAG: hypothetical protein ACKOJF_35095, partial [Planctomycetaceae bacterium]
MEGGHELRFWLAQGVFWPAIALLQTFVLMPMLRPAISLELSRWVVLNRLLTGFVVSSGLRVVYVRLARQDWPLRWILAWGVLALFVAAAVEMSLFWLVNVGFIEKLLRPFETTPVPLAL